jgi:hypothetical protein
VTGLPNLFLDSNIVIHHLCDADSHLCASQLLEKISQKEYTAYVSDFVYSESLGEMKSQYENKKHLTYKHEEAVPQEVRARMSEALEELKKGYNINTVKVPIDQLKVYEYVRNYCFQAKDAPIVLSVEYLKTQLKQDVSLVTGDVHSLLFKARKIIPVAHPSFHFDWCPKECKSYSVCNWKNVFTSKRKVT